MSFHLKKMKGEVEEILIIQILHHHIYNMTQLDHVLFKLKENKIRKNKH